MSGAGESRALPGLTILCVYTTLHYTTLLLNKELNRTPALTARIRSTPSHQSGILPSSFGVKSFFARHGRFLICIVC